MTINILFAAGDFRWAQYETVLRQALSDAGLDFELAPEMPADVVDYIIFAPNGPVSDFSPFGRLKAVLNLWAGVEGVVGNPTLNVPLTRMVDDEGLTQGMVEWVVGHVMRHHLGMDAHIVNPDNAWSSSVPPLSKDRPVTILGFGALGQACGLALAGLGFPVTGWSNSVKSIPGITCLDREENLAKAVTGAQILVLLLPDTPQTQNIVDAALLARLAPGAFILNPGRGPLIEDDALIAALDNGQVAHATLDVFRTEPLPASDPYWRHPQVTVTPHIASETRPDSASRVIADNIRRSEAGLPLLHLVDRNAGY